MLDHVVRKQFKLQLQGKEKAQEPQRGENLRTKNRAPCRDYAWLMIDGNCAALGLVSRAASLSGCTCTMRALDGGAESEDGWGPAGKTQPMRAADISTRRQGRLDYDPNKPDQCVAGLIWIPWQVCVDIPVQAIPWKARGFW